MIFACFGAKKLVHSQPAMWAPGLGLWAKKVIAKNEGGFNLRNMSDEELRAILASVARSLDELADERKKTEAAQQKTETSMRELQKELGGVGGAQGDIAEDLFRRNVTSLLQARKISVKKLHYSLKAPYAEFDLMAENGKEIVIIEVKSCLKSSDIYDFIHRQIPLFKKYFGSDYKGHKIMEGLASMAVSPDLEKEVEKAGLFLFTQTEEGGASLANSSNFTPKAY